METFGCAGSRNCGRICTPSQPLGATGRQTALLRHGDGRTLNSLLFSRIDLKVRANRSSDPAGALTIPTLLGHRPQGPRKKGWTRTLLQNRTPSCKHNKARRVLLHDRKLGGLRRVSGAPSPHTTGLLQVTTPDATPDDMTWFIEAKDKNDQTCAGATELRWRDGGVRWF